MALDFVRDLVKEDISATDQFIVTHLNSPIPLIREMVEYILSCGGKRIRPLVLLLSARALTYCKARHIELAAVIELIHTATLLHDDVVDGATLRRGHQTAHTIWGPEASVLMGDFLYSRAFQIVVDLKHPAILEVFAKATHYIAEGEILQLVNCHHPDTSEDFYFDIIKRKTAKLFEVSAQLGALLASSNEEEILALTLYGNHLGLAYQLIDDALDYSQSIKETGKNIGQDIADGKTTLPLIYAMRKTNGKDLDFLKNTIRSGSSQDLKRVLALIQTTEAIPYTIKTAKIHAQYARESLKPLTHSPYKQALEKLSHFVVERTF